MADLSNLSIKNVRFSMKMNMSKISVPSSAETVSTGKIAKLGFSKNRCGDLRDVGDVKYRSDLTKDTIRVQISNAFELKLRAKMKSPTGDSQPHNNGTANA